MDDEEHQRERENDVDDVARRQNDRRAAHAGRQFQECDHRAGEGQGTNGDAERHLDQALRMDVAGRADVEGLRRVEGAGRHQHGGHADQRVERGDELGHRRHRHPARDHRADRPANGDAEHDKQPGDAVGRRVAGERGSNRDRHAGHAEEIAAAARRRARQAAQRQDEQDPCDEVQNCRQIGVHLKAPIVFVTTRCTPFTWSSSCTSRACAG